MGSEKKAWRERKKGKDSRIRVCANAGDTERNLKKKEKKNKKIERKKEEEIFVCSICVSYVYVIRILSEGETGEERDECRARRETRSERGVFV